MNSTAKRLKSLSPEDQLQMDSNCINEIRAFSIDMVQAANSGHPGAPMGCAPMAYTLFTRFLKFAPSQPKWVGRDRFVLSNGHGCALLYSLLHLTGYDRPNLEDCKSFRQLHSVCAGHPENHLLDGVEIATGPLGQGISNAVGMAMAERHLAATYNAEGHEIVNNYTYVICGDGCLQEGVSSEASSLAGHLKLGKLIVLYDDNNITIDGNTDLSFTEDVSKRYESYGWQVLSVSNGDSADVSELSDAIQKGINNTEQPTLIRIKTTIGFGASKAGTAGVHGAPLGPEEVKKVRENYGLEPNAKFSSSPSVANYLQECRARGETFVAEWQAAFDKYEKAFPEKAAEFKRRFEGELPAGWETHIPKWTPADKALASRQSSGAVLNALCDNIPEIVGGSADLSGSNGTVLKKVSDFLAGHYEGRYFRFGVREHGMAAICNGLAAYGGFIPFAATFLNFAGYALGAMRLSALCQFRVLYIMTHDSISLGEDGPTHQPIGMLATLRSIPNMYVFRPADANEVAGSYHVAMKLSHSPSVFALSRQGLPNLTGSKAELVAKGAYLVHNASVDSPDLTLVATGSEVPIAVDACAVLADSGITASVVSMPCMELFDEQSEEYKKTIFKHGVPVVSIEAASTLGWHKYSHFQIGMHSFGASGPGKALNEHFGFTKESIAEKAKKVVSKLGKNASWLVDPICA